MPILKDIFNRKIDDKTNKMIIHIIGQISYKKGCIEKVVSEIKTWDDKEFISESVTEIIKVHKKYASFSAKTPKEAEEYLLNYLQ